MSKHAHAKYLAVLLILACTTHAIAADVPPTPLLDGVLSTYEKLSTGWLAAIKPVAIKLFWALAGVDMAWSFVTYLKEQKDLPGIMFALAGKIFTLGFFFYLLTNAEMIVPSIIDLFMSAGQKASGFDKAALTPDAIVSIGFETAQAMIVALSDLGVGDMMASALPVTICALAVAIAFTVMAGQLFITLIEMYVLIGGGVILLGFGGSRWTSDMASSYLKAAVASGVKILVTYLILAAGIAIFKDIKISLDNVIRDSLFAFIQTGLFAFLCWNIPSMASSMLSGSSSSTLGGAMGAAMTGAAAVGGVVAGGTAAMQGAKSAGGAALDKLRTAAGGGSAGGGGGGISGGPGSGRPGGSPAGGGFGGASAMGDSYPRPDPTPAHSRPPVVQQKPELPNGGPDAPSEKPKGGDGDMQSQIKGDAERVDRAQSSGGDVVGAADKRARPDGNNSPAGGNLRKSGDAGQPSFPAGTASAASNVAPSMPAAGGASVPSASGKPAGPVSTGGPSSARAVPPGGSPSVGVAGQQSEMARPVGIGNESVPAPGGVQDTAQNVSPSANQSAANLPAGDAAGSGVSGPEKPKENGKKEPPQQRPYRGSILDQTRNLVANDGATVQTPGITMGHGKE